MVTAEDKKALVKFARMGKLDHPEDCFRMKLADLVRCGCQGQDLDYCENRYKRSALWEASWRGTKEHEQIIKLLVEKNATLAFADIHGRTPLHEAAYYGHQSLVQYFLSQGHPVNLKDQWNQTPLFRAIEGGRNDVVEVLMKAKASMNYIDDDGTTVQHLAAFQGQEDVPDFLLYNGAWKNRFYIEADDPIMEEDAGEESPKDPEK